MLATVSMVRLKSVVVRPGATYSTSARCKDLAPSGLWVGLPSTVLFDGLCDSFYGCSLVGLSFYNVFARVFGINGQRFLFVGFGTWDIFGFNDGFFEDGQTRGLAI